MPMQSIVQWVLRIGVFGIFAGHGWYVFNLRPQWFAYLHTVGIIAPYDTLAMRCIGTMDLLIAAITLIKPVKQVLLLAACWAFLTALIRPVSGENWLEFIERAGNWACPLALYFLMRKET